MPYRWMNAPDEPTQTLHLWPHESLPPKGFAAFIATTFILILIPCLPLLGTPILWGLLPFLLFTVLALYLALQRNHHARQILEVLTVSANATHLVRTAPTGKQQEWDCNRTM